MSHALLSGDMGLQVRSMDYGLWSMFYSLTGTHIHAHVHADVHAHIHVYILSSTYTF